MCVGSALTYSTSPLMLYYALTSFTNPAALVTLSSSFSSIAFIIVALIFMFFREKNSIRVRRTLLNPYNYLKIIGLGLLHVAAPSFLFLYAIQWLPPIVPGAFMALVPFWTALFDRFPCVQVMIDTITSPIATLIIFLTHTCIKTYLFPPSKFNMFTNNSA